MLGPDGTLALLAVWVWLYSITQRQEFRSYWWMAYWADYVAFWPSYILPPLAFGFVRICPMLFAARELWGWVGCRCSRDWYAVSRLANHTSRPQSALMAYAAWIGGFTALGFGLPWGNGWSLALFLGTAAFGILGLGRYGCDLVHFRQQLDNFQQGKPIIPGSGSFASAESQLAEIRTQQEEAVRTAVTSERFKVELISNVSHDLRTPLTTILGYSELLQREPLSPEGQEQLRRLQEKAGYMSELVESLFELTKVSSGVVESKKEKIDLVRLLSLRLIAQKFPAYTEKGEKCRFSERRHTRRAEKGISSCDGAHRSAGDRRLPKGAQSHQAPRGGHKNWMVIWRLF